YHVGLAAPPSARTATTGAPEPVVVRAASRAALWSLLQAERDQLARRAPGDTFGSGEVVLAVRSSTLRESLQVALSAVNAQDTAAFASQGVAIWEGAVPSAPCFVFPG